jgi:hypothetical protein
MTPRRSRDQAASPSFAWRGLRLDARAQISVHARETNAMAGSVSFKREIWLPFLDTYRTMCLAPEPAFRQILEGIRDLRFGA